MTDCWRNSLSFPPCPHAHLAFFIKSQINEQSFVHLGDFISLTETLSLSPADMCEFKFMGNINFALNMQICQELSFWGIALGEHFAISLVKY